MKRAKSGVHIAQLLRQAIDLVCEGSPFLEAGVFQKQNIHLSAGCFQFFFERTQKSLHPFFHVTRADGRIIDGHAMPQVVGAEAQLVPVIRFQSEEEELALGQERSGHTGPVIARRRAAGDFERLERLHGGPEIFRGERAAPDGQGILSGSRQDRRAFFSKELPPVGYRGTHLIPCLGNHRFLVEIDWRPETHKRLARSKRFPEGRDSLPHRLGCFMLDLLRFLILLQHLDYGVKLCAHRIVELLEFR